MSTRNILRGKGARCVRLTTSRPSGAECHEIWEPKPPGTLWATPGLLRDSFTLFGISRCGLRFVGTYCTISRRPSNDVPQNPRWETLVSIDGI